MPLLFQMDPNGPNGPNGGHTEKKGSVCTPHVPPEKIHEVSYCIFSFVEHSVFDNSKVISNGK